MSHEIKIPRLGWNMEEGTFVEWLAREGEQIKAGQALFAIEGDKAVAEIEALESGVLRIPADGPKKGQTVKVGQVIGYLGEGPRDRGIPQTMGEPAGRHGSAALGRPVVCHVGHGSKDTTRGARHAGVEGSLDDAFYPDEVGAGASSSLSPSHTERQVQQPRGGRTVSPRAARLAAALGVDWTKVQGTGRTGRVRERDVRAVISRNEPRASASGLRRRRIPQPDAGTRMKCDLTGKVALVTGAAQGIGRAIADSLTDNGARVVYSDVDEAGAARAASARPGCRGVRLDVADRSGARVAVEGVVREAGRLDILINNAGVNTIAGRTTIDEYPESEWDRILSIDLTGVFNVSRAAAAVMRKQGGGRIINIASIAGLVPLRLQCAYDAAKAGVVNLTKAMAMELGPLGILVNGIAPGSIVTQATRKLFYGEGGVQKDSAQRMLAHVPLGRPGTPQEIAVAALFLCAPENSYMTGHVLTVDGGWTAGGFARDF